MVVLFWRGEAKHTVLTVVTQAPLSGGGGWLQGGGGGGCREGEEGGGVALWLYKASWSSEWPCVWNEYIMLHPLAKCCDVLGSMV